MDEMILCKQCGNEIQPFTSKKNNGLCMPCRRGYRDQIDAAREYYKTERLLEKTCPFRIFWRELCEREFDVGFETLTESEKIYFAVTVFDNAIYRGGFASAFWNSSMMYFDYYDRGLTRIGAIESAKLATKAKELVFGGGPIPTDEQAIRVAIDSCDGDSLDEIDSLYYSPADELGALLEVFAVETGMVKRRKDLVIVKNIPEAEKVRIGKLVGRDLISRNGKKHHYSKRKVFQSALREGLVEGASEFAADETMSWLLCLYSDRASFDEYHEVTGQVANYHEMKSSMAAAMTNHEYDESDAWLSFDWDLSWFELPDIDIGDIFGSIDF